MSVGNGILGNLIQVFLLWKGTKRKRGRKLQQPDKEKGSRQESEAARWSCGCR